MSSWEFDQIVSNAGKMNEKIKGLEAEVLKLKTPFEIMKRPHEINFSYYSSDVGSLAYQQKIHAQYEAAIILATENDAINAHNKTVVDKLRKTIVATGFSETRSEYKRNKRVSIPREWTKDIVPEQGVGSVEVERRYQEFLKAVEQYTLKKKKDDELKEKEYLASLEAKKKEIAFIDLCRDLAMDPLTTTSDDIEEHLLSQCKYLRLAHAGLETRNDWSEGAWRVSNALSSFSIDEKSDSVIVDGHIVDEYTHILNNFDDGRSFLHCKYNYNVLFSMVDPKLMAFYNRFSQLDQE